MEKYYPPAVHQKAAKLEQLLLRLETGEELAPLCADLGLALSPKRVQKLQAKYEVGGRQTAALLDGRFGHSQHVTPAIRAYLYERRQAEPKITGPALAAEVEQRFEVTVSVGHINHLLDEMALNRRTGRPRKAVERQPEPSYPPGQANAGLFFPGVAVVGIENGHRIDLPQIWLGAVGARYHRGGAGTLSLPGTAAGHGRNLPPLQRRQPVLARRATPPNPSDPALMFSAMWFLRYSQT